MRVDISGLSLSAGSGYYTYYYRIVAQNTAGLSYGSEKYFSPKVPKFSLGKTYDATNITSNSAMLSGEATTIEHDVWFEFDTIDGEYYYEVNVTENPPFGYSTNISGLSPATTYYYRIAGWDKEYVYYGEQKSFTTLEATATPVVTTTPTPWITPTPECEPKSIKVLPKRLKLNRGANGEVIVTLEGDNCVPEGKTITAIIDKVGSKRISISPTTEVTDESGQIKFTITAKDKIGKTTVTFKTDNLKKSIIVKVR